MRHDGEGDIEVALFGASLARDAHLGARRDPRRDAHAEPLLGDHVAGAVTDGAHRVTHAAGPATAGAAFRSAHVKRDRATEDGIPKRNRELGRRVVVLLLETARAAGPGAAARAREEIGEEISEVSRPAEVRRTRARRGSAPRPAERASSAERPAPLSVRRAGLLRASGVAGLVEVLPALRVLEDLVGRGDLLELLFRGVVAGVHVGVELACESPVGLLDVGLARLALDSQNLVGILRRHRAPTIPDPRRAPNPAADLGTISTAKP